MTIEQSGLIKKEGDMGGKIVKRYGMLSLVLLLVGCAGEQAFTKSARPGETVMLAVGWKQKLTRNDLTVTITPEIGAPVTYVAGDSRIRSVIQAYPDPVSKLVVSDRAEISYPQSGLSFDGSTYNVLPPDFGNLVRNSTNMENDWSNTMVFLDMPTELAPGIASISLSSGGAAVTQPITIEVLPVAAGSRNNFMMSNYSGIGAMMRSVERAPHYVVGFSEASGVVPHSVQIDFVRTLATEGKPWVTHGRGDIQNILWFDNGTLLKVILTPTNGTTVSQLSDFKFYVTGAVTGLTVNSVKAYDVAGNLLSGFSADTEFVNN